MKKTLLILSLILIITLSFSSVLFLAPDSTAFFYTGHSLIKGEYKGELKGNFPTTVRVYYIATNVRDVFNLKDPKFLESFILLENGDKIFKNKDRGFWLSPDIYNLIDVGDKIYKVKWKDFPKVLQNSIIFPRSFKLMDMAKFVNIINFPIYTEDLLKQYLISNGSTVTITESKPKFKVIINRSDYKNLPVSLKVIGDCKESLWRIGKKIYTSKTLTFVATKNTYNINLTVIGNLNTSASTSIQMNFRDLMDYTYQATKLSNTFRLDGNWYVPFFDYTGNSTITYNGQADFLGLEFKKSKTVVHRFLIKDKMPPKIVDDSLHEFYENQPFKLKLYFFDNSGVNYSILLNDKKLTDFSTLTLKYGKYKLSVIATDNFENSTSYSTEIRVLDTIPPIAKVSNYIVNENQTFVLDGSKSTDNGTIVSYKWIIGDKVFYGKRVKMELEKSGEYKGSLIVTDDSLNTDVANFTIIVKDNVPPLLIFSQTTIQASKDQILTFKPFMAKDDSGEVTITWIMKDPKVFYIGKEFRYKFLKNGKYFIDVIAQDKYHNQTMVTLTVTIK
jgi:hypothetical protein